MKSRFRHECSWRRSSASLLVWLGFVVVLDARVIDDFETGPYALVGANATVTQTQNDLDPSRVVGGGRFISFRSFAVPPSTLSMAGLTGTLDVGPGGCCTYLTVRYGGISNPLQLNLLDDGSDRFRIDFAGLTTNIPFSVPTIFARDSQGRTASIVSTSSVPVQPAAPFSLVVPFAQFPQFDWTNVQSMEITVSRYGGGSGGPGKSFSLDSIVTVPEPSGPSTYWLPLVAAAAKFACRFRYVAIG